MNTIPFYLGQTGLALAAIAGIMILHFRGMEPDSTRPPWYYFVSIWAISVAAALLFSRPYINAGSEMLPKVGYLFRFAFGLERCVILFSYRYGSHAARLPVRVISRVNSGVSLITLALLVGVFGWAFYGKLTQNGEDTRRLSLEIKENRREMLSDTGRATRMQGQIDTLTAQLFRSEKGRVLLLGQLAISNKRLEEMADAIVRLSRNVKMVGATIDRRSTPIPTPQPAVPRPLPLDALDPRRVVLLPEQPHSPKRK